MRNTPRSYRIMLHFIATTTCKNSCELNPDSRYHHDLCVSDQAKEDVSKPNPQDAVCVSVIKTTDFINSNISTHAVLNGRR